MQRGLAAGDLYYVRLLFVAHHAVEHGRNLVERAELRAVLAAARIADGTG